jgi:hypothetical protein
LLEQGETQPARTRTADEAQRDLLATRESIGIALAEEQRRKG